MHLISSKGQFICLDEDYWVRRDQITRIFTLNPNSGPVTRVWLTDIVADRVPYIDIVGNKVQEILNILEEQL